MEGPHDVGGKHGLGLVNPEPNEPVFHYPFEGRVYGLAFCTIASGVHTVDAKRHAIETMSHPHYLDSSYYEHWLYAIEKIMHDKGLITKDEVDARVAEQAPATMEAHPKRPENPSELAQGLLNVLQAGTPHEVETTDAPLFKDGDRVRVKNVRTKRHLRVPGYTKNQVGTVQVNYGSFGDPEARAHEEEPRGVYLYRVVFEPTELFESGRAGDTVAADLFETYLEPA